MTALLDPRGCLTDAGFAALDGAPLGKAPGELAAHLAGCGRCQQRVLARAEAAAAGGAKRERRAPPPAWRIWAILAAFIVMTMAVLATAHRLLGR